MSNTYCPLPWIHLGTHPHGGVTPCCISDHSGGKNRARNYSDTNDVFLNLNEHSIDDHINSDYFKEVRTQMLAGEQPRACRRCYEEESKGLVSKRQYESSQYPSADYRWASDNTSADGSIRTDVRFVELRLGNVCNVRCRTCNPASSSQWRRDYEGIVEKLEFVSDGYTWLDHSRDFKWPESESFYEDLYNCAPAMEVLYINGGEPTLIKAHWAYIRRLVESGRAANIVLWYNINMTNVPDYAINLWSQFKEARICCSIDDLDLRNHYIRYPTMWASVRENLMTVLRPSLKVRITQTVSAYNYLYLDEFMRWAPCPVDMNYVYDPSYLSPAVLPPQVRSEIHAKYRTTMGNDPHLGTLLSLYNNTDWDPVKWREFCLYNDALDELRPPLTWRKVFPELISMCEKYGIQHDFR